MFRSVVLRAVVLLNAIANCQSVPAQEDFAKAVVAGIVTVVEGDAHETISRLKGPVDMDFMDAERDAYLDYLKKVLRPGFLCTYRVQAPQASGDSHKRHGHNQPVYRRSSHGHLWSFRSRQALHVRRAVRSRCSTVPSGGRGAKLAGLPAPPKNLVRRNGGWLGTDSP